jgi:Heterokaryon incompatibility protein (HET)
MEYRPLDTDVNEIRLITLLSSDNQDIVRCSFEHVSLINPPEFSALSYCWGNPEVTEDILINGYPFPVTTNLESALRHLMAVDAVCINQADKVEKSQQLLWMGSIYRRAKEVMAWIGEEDPDSCAAIDVLTSDDKSKSLCLQPRDKIDSIINLVERPYWKRVWVIQEIAFARQTTIHCGRRSFFWVQFVSAIKHLAGKEEITK